MASDVTNGLGFTVSRAEYAKGMMLVRVVDDGKSRVFVASPVQRAIEELKGRYTGRERGYVMSPAKVAKLERLLRERATVQNPGPGAAPARGDLIELGLLTGLDGMRWSMRAAPVLAYDANARLFVVYAGRVVAPSNAAQRRRYARTHWGLSGPGATRAGAVADGPFVSLGPSASIQYTTRKGGDRELVDYVHEWGEGGAGRFVPPTVLAHDCGNRRCPWSGAIVLSGGTYRVEDRGIVG